MRLREQEIWRERDRRVRNRKRKRQGEKENIEEKESKSGRDYKKTGEYYNLQYFRVGEYTKNPRW